MLKLRFNPRPGDILVMIGVAALVGSLISKISLVAKSVILIASVVAILFGALVETPLLDRFNEGKPEQFIKKEDNKLHPFQK